MVEILRLHFFLIRLSMVKVVEVGNDDRYGKGNRKHTGNCAKRANDFAPDSHWPASANVQQQKRNITNLTVALQQCDTSLEIIKRGLIRKWGANGLITQECSFFSTRNPI